jgi:broad specificity phosphatase PhoE
VTTFYLVRHAEKDAPENILSGRAEGVHLTERGRRQADAVSAQLAAHSLEHIFSSPASRARETAQPLAKAKKLPVRVSAAFHEVDFGSWTNLPFKKLERDPRWRAYNSYRSVAAIPEGESLRQVQRRFVDELRDIAEDFPHDNIAIFSHREPIVAAILHFIGLSLDAWPRFAVDPASVTTLTLEGGNAQIVRLNDISASGR